MWPFKKKKIYKVLYADDCCGYDYAIVEATDMMEAWEETKRLNVKPHRPTVWIRITEL